MRTSQAKRHSISTLNYNALMPHMSSVSAESQNNFPNEKQDSDKRKRHTLLNNNDYEKSENQHSWEPLILTKHTIVKYDFELPSKIPSNKNKVLAEIAYSLNSLNFKRAKGLHPRTKNATLDQILNQSSTAVLTQTKGLSQNLVEFLG